MNKHLLIILSSLAVGCTRCENSIDKEKLADKARTISYQITITREDSCDQEYWKKITEDTIEAIEAGKSNDSMSSFYMLESFINGIQRLYQKGEHQGIHGEMKISINEESQKVIDQCPCTSTRGLCSCIEK